MKKEILLIGGSKGIGFKIAEKLSQNHDITVASRNPGKLDELNIKHLEFDVEKDNIEDLDLPDKLDGLVYCPGSINLKPFKMHRIEDFKKEMDLNFFGLIKSVHGVMPKLQNAENASLIFFSTVAVKVGMPFHTSVAAAKGAIEGFARSLAAEYAPDMRVNVIAPSLTDTELSEKLLNNDKKKEKMKERHPMKRVGNPEDIANLATFLLSDESSWITGQVMGVDGGLSTLNLS
ncbi:SDR family NAD(P)-dependent oxidoreductase [Autumnicola edwardsiae]|uniref:SDR family oxidoreductase n=1 Tax=Autumnicola edwardsiae TaxID=3075594 RepID=A0ABU3CUI0_9FLAO|nr:SDR family oxidoreductase [Zunongwangia sp. F297]MDT0650016.1 SDR family oxidoreductase [Zunongwangia sp. F297]